MAAKRIAVNFFMGFCESGWVARLDKTINGGYVNVVSETLRLVVYVCVAVEH
jgi:hypothetical protein